MFACKTASSTLAPVPRRGRLPALQRRFRTTMTDVVSPSPRGEGWGEGDRDDRRPKSPSAIPPSPVYRLLGHCTFVSYTKHAREFIPQITNHLPLHSLYSLYSTIFAKR